MDDGRKVAMISGASRGIGAEIAAALAEAGYALSLGVRRPEAVRDRFGADGPDLLIYPYEATDPAAAPAWVAATLARFGRIDVLVNNAGIATYVGLEDGDPDELDRLFAVDVKAPFLLIRAALPALKASGAGRVVNVASLSGKRVMGLNAGYQMAKHAVVALTHAVRRLGWEHGIRATALCPGYVATDLTAAVSDPPPEAMTDPKDLARLVVTVVGLPNTAAVAELLVNCRYEHML
ncbi:short-chain dehydrogenase [Prosthecomicrobium hirschii]|uniref:SDR family NAD(P)-dependent oxidoreductase n=1 Tax=Prosthecodimorpha hirschii TaxID=665126 RepID=UPI00112C01EC|nr:SDR family NAD(P)-dependent oxidoreductase [Prosthecomicrobium hirschii]TPQ52821.1 short-chain dehydrogenase [Prosthecomicrobium hirschii]